MITFVRVLLVAANGYALFVLQQEYKKHKAADERRAAAKAAER